MALSVNLKQTGAGLLEFNMGNNWQRLLFGLICRSFEVATKAPAFAKATADKLRHEEINYKSRYIGTNKH